MADSIQNPHSLCKRWKVVYIESIWISTGTAPCICPWRQRDRDICSGLDLGWNLCAVYVGENVTN